MRAGVGTGRLTAGFRVGWFRVTGSTPPPKYGDTIRAPFDMRVGNRSGTGRLPAGPVMVSPDFAGVPMVSPYSQTDSSMRFGGCTDNPGRHIGTMAGRYGNRPLQRTDTTRNPEPATR